MSDIKRRVILDTETTGMPAIDGHRIIEIGCVEMLDRTLTGNHYHQYINPERLVDDGAFNVHGLSDDFLSDMPVMADCIQEFLDFITGAELIIHNASFDVGFLDQELSLLDRNERIVDICTIIDTVQMARKKHPGTKVNLDALTRRYKITQFNRELHGALLDSQILAQVYLAMTGGQSGLKFADNTTQANSEQQHMSNKKYHIVDVPLSEEEISLHQKILNN